VGNAGRQSELLDSRSRDHLRALIAELGVVRLNQSSGYSPFLRSLRVLAELESVGLYSVRNRTGRWEIERWEAVGGAMEKARPLAVALFAGASDFPMYYNPLKPASAQRNRVIDAYAWIHQEQPGTWETHPMSMGILRPLRAHDHHQPRALLCKGSNMLGWFGGMDPKPPTKRQMHMLGKLVGPMRDRLNVEQRLFESAYVRSAVDTLLDRIGAPAFIVDSKGTVQESNRSGTALLAAGHRELRVRIRRAALRQDAADFELIPICAGELRFSIVVLRTNVDTRVQSCIELCVVRWSLTPRQAEVLGHVVRGLSTAAISTLLGTVERTVELHITAIFDRAGIDSRAALVGAVLTSL
jgi:DNA-binding CsgD family transcriptional regulator